MSDPAVSLSIVIPVYNEAESIAPLLARLYRTLHKIGTRWEIIAVDDGSRDGSKAALLAARADEPRLRVIRLSRNFGKDAALAAGLRAARGEAVVLMDADLQHPPETIPRLLQAHATGIDVVYGLRCSRLTEGWLRSALSSSFYRIFSQASDVAIPANAGDFRLLSRRVVEALNALPERKRFMKGLYAWVGFSQQAVLYDVEPRWAGASRWSFLNLFGYAWNGLVAFSAAPLRFWSIAGSMIAAGSLAYAIWIGVTTILHGRDVPGYATLAVAIFFLGGLQLISIGVLGEYVARIFDEAKQRPLFVIEERFGFEGETRAPHLRQSELTDE